MRIVEKGFFIAPMARLTDYWASQGRRLTVITRLIGGAARTRTLLALCAHSVRIFRLSGWSGLKADLLARTSDRRINYTHWTRLFDSIGRSDRLAIRRHIASFDYMPRISVILPVYNTPIKWLKRAILSVLDQLYQNWELCIVDDASVDPAVRATLLAFQKKDSRIKAAFHTKNSHISATLNTGLQMASGEFVAFLDHDDELSEHALYMVAETLNAFPETVLAYSDEDKIDEIGWRFDPYFKPDWNPDLLLGQNYIAHLAVYRKSVVIDNGGFRSNVDGSQDWDLALRATESVDEDYIKHLPYVLYHWRAIPGSTAWQLSEKTYALQAAKTVVEDHLMRSNVKASVQLLDNGYLRLQRAIPKPPPLVSFIIPTRNGHSMLRTCIESIEKKTLYHRYEIIVINNQSSDPETLAYLDSISRKPSIRVLDYDKPFNYSAINNFAVTRAAGEIIGFVNNDIAVITPDWLTEMVSHAVRPEVGAVGAKLLFPDDTIQHAGVVVGLGRVGGHAYMKEPRLSGGQMGRLQLVQNVGAVTGACMVLRKSVFLEVGGFDKAHLAIAFNDVDLCLRIRKKGYKIVWTPVAELYHLESASRGYEDTPEKQKRFQSEVDYMLSSWNTDLECDPAHNPNLSLVYEEKPYETLALPPRVRKPWTAS